MVMSKNKMNYRAAAHRARIVSRVLCHEDRGCVFNCEYFKSIVHVTYAIDFEHSEWIKERTPRSCLVSWRSRLVSYCAEIMAVATGKQEILVGCWFIRLIYSVVDRGGRVLTPLWVLHHPKIFVKSASFLALYSYFDFIIPLVLRHEPVNTTSL